MVHLPALPGAPDYDDRPDGSESDGREAVREQALTDARRLAAAGVDGLIVENLGDAPYFAEDVPKHVVAEMTAVTRSVVETVDVPIGVNVLRNDATAALSVAAAAGAEFVRVNVHAGAAVTDQGVIEGRAAETIRLRDRIDADVAVLADVRVKHASPLGDRSLREQVVETVDRGRADGVVVSGAATGAATPRDRLRTVREVIDEEELAVPLYVGSGVTAETAADLLDPADGLIVGTAIKEGGETTNPVDPERARRLVEAVG